MHIILSATCCFIQSISHSFQLSIFTELLALLSNNHTGPIPSTLGELTNLLELELDVNFLTGTIPTEIGLIPGLQVFFADFNNLEGTVGQEICALRAVNLTTLAVDCTEDSVNFVECDCCTNCAPIGGNIRAGDGNPMAWLARHAEADELWQKHEQDTLTATPRSAHMAEQEAVHSRSHVIEQRSNHIKHDDLAISHHRHSNSVFGRNAD